MLIFHYVSKKALREHMGIFGVDTRAYFGVDQSNPGSTKGSPDISVTVTPVCQLGTQPVPPIYRLEMGQSYTPISFWTDDIPIKEVQSASSLELFKLKNLNQLSSYRGSLLVDTNNSKHLIFEFRNSLGVTGEFVEFIAK